MRVCVVPERMADQPGTSRLVCPEISCIISPVHLPSVPEQAANTNLSEQQNARFFPQRYFQKYKRRRVTIQTQPQGISESPQKREKEIRKLLTKNIKSQMFLFNAKKVSIQYNLNLLSFYFQ